MSSFDLDEFVRLFLTGDALRAVLTYLCNTAQGLVMDPITHTICMVLSTPVQAVLTQVGVAPFKGQGTCVFPYRLMNNQQKDFLKDFVLSVQPSVSGAMAATQIGGGCMLGTSSARRVLYLPPKDVIRAFCEAVMMSKAHPSAPVRRSVCSIVVQRVCGAVHLDRSTLQDISACLSSREEGWEAGEAI